MPNKTMRIVLELDPSVAYCADSHMRPLFKNLNQDLDDFAEAYHAALIKAEKKLNGDNDDE